MARKLSIAFGLIAFIFLLIDLVLFFKHEPAPINFGVSPIIPQKEISVIIAGDIMLGRSVMTTSLEKGDPNFPFEKVIDVLKRADIVFGNLESPIVANCPSSNSGFKFCADPKMLEGLKYGEVDVVSIANNHIRNYGEDGVKQTENYLGTYGIDYVGAGNIITKSINGTTFGFLGFDYVDKKPSDSDYQLIKDSKSKVDVLIVMVHWGSEYTSTLSPTQKSTAQSLVDAGADVVAGSHPHWVQPIDYINGKPIFYSLGNFIFDQPWSEETKKGLVVRLTYRNGKLVNTERLPIYIKNLAQPEWVN